MRYAVEIAQCGSINQAAQNLYVTQSSLSKAMKELENVLGYAVFQRTPAGTAVTEEGQSFLELAHQIVYKMEVLERQLQNRNERLAAMKISIPRATYITYAFTEFFKEIQNQEQIQINPQGVTGQGNGLPLIQGRPAYEIPGARPGVALGELDVPGPQPACRVLQIQVNPQKIGLPTLREGDGRVIFRELPSLLIFRNTRFDGARKPATPASMQS